jgi:hypothetical protein
MIQSDPFSAVRIQKNQNIQPSSQVSNDTEDPFSQVRINEVEGFPGLREIGRHAARTGSRIAETIGGIPGDVQNLIQSGVFAGLEKLVGHEASPEVREQAKRFSEVAPSSSELKKFSEESTEGFTSPQNQAEKSADEFTELAASLLGPMKFRKVLGVSLGSQLAKEGVKLLGVGEGGQEATKFGTMFLLSMFNPRGAMKYSQSQFDKANQLAKGASINATQMNSNLSSLKTDLLKGVTTSEKNTVLKPIEELLEKTKNGKIAVQELTAAKRDINKLMGEPETLEGAKKLLKVVGREVDDAIKPFEKINPAFKEAYRPANEIFSAVMQGNKIQNAIKRNLSGKSVLGTIAGEAVLGHPELIVPTLGTVVGAVGLAKGVDFFMRLATSPQLQKFYAKAMAAAAAEDISALRHYSQKIDEEFNRQTLQ